MTYTIKNSPGGYDIYKDGEYVPAEAIVEVLNAIQANHERMITKMQVDSHGKMGLPISTTQAINLYDAGWRKQP